MQPAISIAQLFGKLFKDTTISPDLQKLLISTYLILYYKKLIEMLIDLNITNESSYKDLFVFISALYNKLGEKDKELIDRKMEIQKEEILNTLLNNISNNLNEKQVEKLVHNLQTESASLTTK